MDDNSSTSIKRYINISVLLHFRNVNRVGELCAIHLRLGVQDDVAGEARKAADPQVELGGQDGHGHHAQQEGGHGAAVFVGLSAMPGMYMYSCASTKGCSIIACQMTCKYFGRTPTPGICRHVSLVVSWRVPTCDEGALRALRVKSPQRCAFIQYLEDEQSRGMLLLRALNDLGSTFV